MISNKQAIKDILDLLNTGYRKTKGGREVPYLRQSRFWFEQDPGGGYLIRDRWNNRPLARWLPEGHLLLINTDRTSSFYAEEIWWWVVEWEQAAMPLSFAAAQLAGIAPASIRPVVYAPVGEVERHRTKRKDTPEYVKTASMRYDYNARRWRRRYKPPAEDGYYHWVSHKWTRNQPEGVFTAAYVRRVPHPTMPNRSTNVAGHGLFISAWDSLDYPARYFLSQLPVSVKNPKTMKQARDMLEPDVVKLARKQKLRVVRQGDVFAIETNVTRKELEAELRTRSSYYKWWRNGHQKWVCVCGDKHCYSYFVNPPPPGAAPKGVMPKHYKVAYNDNESAREYRDRMRIHGTAHTCTELITLRDGTQYGRGTLIHQPAILEPNRPRDHRNVRLGDKWWLLVRNTVPPAGQA